MMSNSQIRARAREALGNSIFEERWLFALLVGLIITAINSVASYIPFASLIIVGPLGVSAAGIFLSIMRTGEKARIEGMFDGFKDFAPNLLLGLMISLFTFLWSLLFIIPGIIKGLSYSMAYYIKIDHPEYDWKACIEESKKMTYGYKWQIFCLQLSFIGWILLGMLCCGIGVLWVTPYSSAALAEFYNQLKAKDAPADDSAEAFTEETAL
ncbi:MAG: DUF975 family protein [Clostridia bacterium]|nr:DUF975 family protein [Clostridia bacterium]